MEMVMLTILKTKEGKEVYVHHIKELRMFPEELTGDGEYDHMHCWELDAILRNGDVIKLFEADEFDNKKEIFYSPSAVKGDNWQKVVDKMNKIQSVIDDVNKRIRIIDV